MFSTIVKWKQVARPRKRAVSERLKHLVERQPSGVPRLLEFGWCDDRVRLCFERVNGEPLTKWLYEPRMATGETISHEPFQASEIFQVGRELLERLAAWREQGFVHGDVSPRNILIDRNGGGLALWAIDWVCDLQSHEATPRFAAPEVFRGKRTFESDRYAIAEILCILATANSNANRQFPSMGQAEKRIL